MSEQTPPDCPGCQERDRHIARLRHEVADLRQEVEQLRRPPAPPPWYYAPPAVVAPAWQPPAPARPMPLHPNFWWGLLWCAGMLLFTQVPGGLVAAFVLIAGMIASERMGGAAVPATPEGVFNTPLGQFAFAAAIVISQVLLILLSLLVLRVVAGRDWPRQVGLRRPSKSHVLLAVAGIPALMVLAAGVTHLLHDVLGLPSLFDALGSRDGMGEMEKSFSNWPLFLGPLLIGLLPGVGEELWCRAFLGRGLVGRHGYVLGVLGTSLLFGLIHIDPVQGSMAAVLGIALHYAYLTSRSLVIPMLLHFLNNSLAVALARVPEMARLGLEQGRAPWAVYATGGVLLVAVAWAFYQSRARLVPAGDGPAWQPPYPGAAWPPPGSDTRVEAPAPSLAVVGLVLLALAGFAAALAAALRVGAG
jgi:uncharacterized protein